MVKNPLLLYWGKYGSAVAWIIFISAVIWLSWFNLVKSGIESDIKIYHNYANEYIENNKIPYRDFSPEYPPGAFLLFVLPRLYVKSIIGYKIIFTFITDFFLAIGAFFIFRKGKSLSLILFSAFLLSCQPVIIFQRFDAIVGIVLFISLLQFTRKKYSLSVILLAIGAYLKFFPIILFPFYLLWLPGNAMRLKQSAVFFITIALLLAPFFLNGASLEGIMHFIVFNKERGIQIESLWASILMLIKPLQQNFQVVHRYGAIELISSLTPLFTKLSFYFSGVYLLGLLVVNWLFFKKNIAKNKYSFFFAIMFLAIAGFILFNKVFSPQYVLWLVPLAPILIHYNKPRQNIVLITMFFLFLIATSRIWPQNYYRLIQGETYAVNNLLFRNTILLLMLCYFLKISSSLYLRRLTDKIKNQFLNTFHNLD